MVRDDFTITEKAPTRGFSWLKAPTNAFTFKTQAALRIYANQTACPARLTFVLLGAFSMIVKYKVFAKVRSVYQISTPLAVAPGDLHEDAALV